VEKPTLSAFTDLVHGQNLITSVQSNLAKRLHRQTVPIRRISGLFNISGQCFDL